jgi:hypothetical protein
MDASHFGKKFGKPLAPELEFNFPVPDEPLRTSPSQNVSWSQWMDEIEPWLRRLSREPPHPMDPNMKRFVLD